IIRLAISNFVTFVLSSTIIKKYMVTDYPQKVLSVDDVESNNFLIHSYLKLGDIHTILADSGEEALELIRKNHFCLFILDVMMGRMSGFELALKIREIDEHKFTPIIFITANIFDNDSISEGYKSGAIDYLIKPVNKNILLQKVKFFLELDRQKQEIIEQRNQLVESQKRFFDIANSIADWVWEIDRKGRYVYVSDKVEKIMGYKPSELIGKTPFDLMTPEDAEKVKLKFEKISIKNAPFNDLINWNITKSGKPICILTNGVPIFDGNNQPAGYRGVDKDITSKIKSEEEIRFHAKLLQNVNDSIIYTNLEGIIQYVNKGTKYTFGYEPEFLMGNTLSVLYPEQYKDLSISELFIVIDFKPYESEWQGLNKKGELIWLDVKINLMQTPEGKPEGYIIVSKDISHRIKAKDEIIRSIITGEDNERKRISSDLHDGLGQLLTASSLNFNSIKHDIPLLSKKKQEEYNSGIKFLEKSIREIRNIAHNLMPNTIEYFGLIAAVNSLFNSIKTSSKFSISLSENIGKKRFDHQLEINMYRITQEILNNAIKHSNATKIQFQYQVYDDELIFTYEDDGVGFNYNKKKKSGSGLSNIKNRVTSMSGFISINSKAGKGTSISIEIAL
ncbi:MAG: PAS domain S-box protein, partial [Bacteroidota bacterium]